MTNNQAASVNDFVLRDFPYDPHAGIVAPSLISPNNRFVVYNRKGGVRCSAVGPQPTIIYSGEEDDNQLLFVAGTDVSEAPEGAVLLDKETDYKKIVDALMMLSYGKDYCNSNVSIGQLNCADLRVRFSHDTEDDGYEATVYLNSEVGVTKIVEITVEQEVCIVTDKPLSQFFTEAMDALSGSTYSYNKQWIQWVYCKPGVASLYSSDVKEILSELDSML
jgi:hypothetical protein